jgi:hypothetical protein
LLPQLGLSVEDADEAKRTADEIVESAQGNHPDPGKVFAAGQRLLPILSRAGTAVAGAALVDGLVEALHAAGI